MRRRLLIEEFHVSLFIPQDLSAKEIASVRRTLRSQSFERKHRQAVTELASGFTSLSSLTLKISR
jgi:hypothetical protein